jgi:hypothetical protein
MNRGSPMGSVSSPFRFTLLNQINQKTWNLVTFPVALP